MACEGAVVVEEKDEPEVLAPEPVVPAVLAPSEEAKDVDEDVDDEAAPGLEGLFVPACANGEFDAAPLTQLQASAPPGGVTEPDLEAAVCDAAAIVDEVVVDAAAASELEGSTGGVVEAGGLVVPCE